MMTSVLFSNNTRNRISISGKLGVRQREQALEQVIVLSGLLPICAWCKKIRDKENQWVLES